MKRKNFYDFDVIASKIDREKKRKETAMKYEERQRKYKETQKQDTSKNTEKHDT